MEQLVRQTPSMKAGVAPVPPPPASPPLPPVPALPPLPPLPAPPELPPQATRTIVSRGHVKAVIRMDLLSWRRGRPLRICRVDLRLFRDSPPSRRSSP